MIPFTWDNLRQFFKWASEQDAYDSPYVSWSDEAVTIDGYVTRKNFQAWLAQQEGSKAPAEMTEYSIVRDESGKILGAIKIRTSLKSIRLPYLLPGGGKGWGELMLVVRQWRCADGKIEPFFFCPAEHLPYLERVKGFAKAPAVVPPGTTAGI